MNMKTRLFHVLASLIVISILITACNGVVGTPVSTQPPEMSGAPAKDAPPDPVTGAPKAPAAPASAKVLTVGWAASGDVPTLDPALAEDSTSHQIIKPLFTGLVVQSETSALSEPGIARSWEAVNNPDGTQTITFHLNDNIPWVRWDGKKVVKVQTCDGTDRMVTAQDFAYGIQRNLEPANASPYAFLLGFVLKGANDYNAGTNKDFSTVGVKAIDSTTLEMTFLTPAVYNLNISGLWVANASPKWLIEGETCPDGSNGSNTEARGDRWTETGFLQSYGPYTLKEWVHDSYITLVKNPFWPGIDSVPQAKIDEINFPMLDLTAAFADYEAGNIDTTLIPVEDMDRVKTDAVLSAELKIAPSPCTYYYGFNTKEAVVNDVRVRRALSLAVDRQGLIDNVLKGNQEPAQWFSRPGLAGAPTVASYPDLGVKFDVTKAKAELQSYLDEKKLTADKLDLTLVYNTGASHQKIAEAIQQMWKENLGVDVKLVGQEWKTFLVTTKSRETPQIFRNGWCQDYTDTNNFLRDTLGVNGSQNPAENGEPYGGVNWKNDAYEKLLVEAAAENDSAKRVELYAQAEKILNWDDAAIIPVYWYTRVQVTKPYVIRTYSVLGGQESLEKWDIAK